MGNQRNQSVLLTVGKLAETLQQLSFVQGKLRAVQAHAQFVTQGTLLNETLLKTGNDFRVHAAVMIARHLGNALAHPVWQAYDKLVCSAARVDSLFHWAHSIDRIF